MLARTHHLALHTCFFVQTRQHFLQRKKAKKKEEEEEEEEEEENSKKPSSEKEEKKGWAPRFFWIPWRGLRQRYLKVRVAQHQQPHPQHLACRWVSAGSRYCGWTKIRHHFETMGNYNVRWFLQGNHHSRFFRWCETDFVHPQYGHGSKCKYHPNPTTNIGSMSGEFTNPPKWDPILDSAPVKPFLFMEF